MLPLDADESFLMWAEATETGKIRELMNSPLTQEGYFASWMLHWFAPLKYAPIPPTPQELEEQRIAQALTSGWGQ